MINSNPCCHKFQSIGSSFHCCLSFGIPVYGCPSDNVENGCDRPASDQVMMQIGIHIMYSGDMFPSQLRNVSGDDFFWTPIGSSGPVKFLILDVCEIWLPCSESDCTFREICQITKDPFDSVKMAFSWLGSEPGESHGADSYIKCSK